MNNLESLKNELLSQKALIEKGGGYVRVSGINPSPSEITEGIKSIAGTDLTIATATEEDVKIGKTFFAGGPELKTGTASIDTESIHHIFMAPMSVQTSDDIIYYTCPDNITTIKRYCFENNFNKIHLRFSVNIEQIREYAFYNAKNMIFDNLHELTKLNRICSNAFNFCNGSSLDLDMLPDSILVLEESCFANVVRVNGNIKFPQSLISTGANVFKCETRRVIGNVDITSSSITSINSSVFYGLACNCDLICPSNMTTIGTYANYNGCFNNVILPASITSIQNYAFGASSSQALSNFYMRNMVFEGTKPPTIGTNVIAGQHFTNGLKIYVPDEAVEAYKAVSNLSKYADIIYPMSQKD